jgi:pimeloyl-ACP methyl ester carboxylesterase
MPVAAVNGIELHYELEGSGPPLLLIAGLGAGRLTWAPIVPVLADGFTCITFDNRGTGPAPPPPGPYTIDQLADDAAALIDELDLGSVAAVGWSLGGCVLQSLLLDHPEKISQAVLLSTLPAYTSVQHAWLDGLLALRRAGVGSLVEGAAMLPWVFTPALLADHHRVAELLELMTQDPFPTSYEGIAAQGEAIRVYDSRARLHEVTAPTLVLVGAEDVLTPVAQSIELAELIPDAKLVVLPRGGHAALLEFPLDALAEIRSFLGAEVEV